MGRHKNKDKENRRLILTWLNIASKMSPGNTFFVPMKHGVLRTKYVRLCNQIIEEMKASFDESIFHRLKAYGTSKRGILYLAIEKLDKGVDIAFIRDKNEKEKTLQILTKSKYTRKAQIMMLLSEGYNKKEVLEALGKSITPEELKLLQ